MIEAVGLGVVSAFLYELIKDFSRRDLLGIYEKACERVSKEFKLNKNDFLDLLKDRKVQREISKFNLTEKEFLIEKYSKVSKKPHEESKKIFEKIYKVLQAEIRKNKNNKIRNEMTFVLLERGLPVHTPLLSWRSYNNDIFEGLQDRELVGRKDYIKRFEDFLNSKISFLVLYGRGGVGKSRLCIEFAKISEEKGLKAKFVNPFLKNPKTKLSVDDVIRSLEENMILFLEDYQDMRDFLSVLIQPIREKNVKMIVTTRRSFIDFLKTDLRIQEPLMYDDLREFVPRETFDLIENELKEKVEKKEIESISEKIYRISGGNPYFIILACQHYLKKGNLKGIEDRLQLVNSILEDLREILGDVVLEVLEKISLLRYLEEEKIPKEWESVVDKLVEIGYLKNWENIYFVSPDILADTIVRLRFFSGEDLKLRYKRIVEEFGCEKPKEILTSILNIKDEREIYKKAAEFLFENSKPLEPKTFLDLAIECYGGFNEISLVEKHFGKDFWKRAYEVDDADYYLKTGIYLYKTSQWDEAEKCYLKSKEIYEKSRDKYSFGNLGAVIGNLGSVYYRKGEW
ncbi:MAG: hypothetical protein ACE5K0_10335 [Candidatus Methanofastidiosia archaeon]